MRTATKGTHPRVSKELHDQRPQLVSGHAHGQLYGSPVARPLPNFLRCDLQTENKREVEIEGRQHKLIA